VEKGLLTNQLTLTIGYDIENLTNPQIARQYQGQVVTDFYGRNVPKHGHGTANLAEYTASARLITEAMMALYDRITDQNLLVRRINLVANHVLDEKTLPDYCRAEQLNLFDQLELSEKKEKDPEVLEREKNLQKAMLSIKQKYGKNSILKGMNFEEGATAVDRNMQIGGHKA
jgi:DNA polymerase V